MFHNFCFKKKKKLKLYSYLLNNTLMINGWSKIDVVNIIKNHIKKKNKKQT